MPFNGQSTGQINTQPMYGPARQSQVGNYGQQPRGRGFGMDYALAMRNYLAALEGTRPRRKEPTLPLLYLYGY